MNILLIAPRSARMNSAMRALNRLFLKEKALCLKCFQTIRNKSRPLFCIKKNGYLYEVIMRLVCAVCILKKAVRSKLFFRHDGSLTAIIFILKKIKNLMDGILRLQPSVPQNQR